MKIGIGIFLLLGIIICSCGSPHMRGSQQLTTARPGQKVYTADNQNSFHTGPSYFDEDFPYQTRGSQEDALVMNSYGSYQVYSEQLYNRYNEYILYPESDPLVYRPYPDTRIHREDSINFAVHYPVRNAEYYQPEHNYYKNNEVSPDMANALRRQRMSATDRSCCPSDVERFMNDEGEVSGRTCKIIKN